MNQEKLTLNRTTLVWDWVVRLFHAVFALGWIAALVIALGTSHSSRTFPYHTLIGLTLGFAVTLRLVWGFIGTRPARLRALLYSPKAVFGYIRDAMLWKPTMHPGHNPASAWAIIAMLLLTAMQVCTGLAVGSGVREAKEIHEVIAYAMIAVIVAHVLGVILHTARHREIIALSMADGKRACEPVHGIRSARPAAGILFLILVFLFGASVYRSYDAPRQTTKVPLFGKIIQVGESEVEDD